MINRTLKFDAAGRTVETYDPLVHTCCENNHTYGSTYDGNGARIKEISVSTPPNGPSSTTFKYEIRSTVLGGETVGELETYDWHTNINRRFITPINDVKLGAAIEETAPEGIKSFGNRGAELDTRGADVGEENPYTTGGDGGGGYPSTGGDPTNFQRCSVDGSVYECSKLRRNFIKTPQFLNLLVMHKSRTNGQLPQYDYTTTSDPNGTEITGGWGGTSQDGRTIVNVDVSIPDETLEQVFRGFASTTFYSRDVVTTASVYVYPLQNGKKQEFPPCIRNYLINRWKLNKDAVNQARYSREDKLGLNFFVSGSPLGLADGVYTANINAAGFTWGYDVTFMKNVFDTSNGINADEVALAGHEIKHVAQHHGDANYRAKYLTNYLVNWADAGFFEPLVDLWAKGFKGIHDTAYRGVNFEEDARDFGDKITEDIEKHGNPCNAASKNGNIYNP